MSSALGVVKREGAQGASHHKGETLPAIKRLLYTFNTLDVVFSEIFLFPTPINSTQFYLKCVINFAYNRVIGLVIKSEHCFQ